MIDNTRTGQNITAHRQRMGWTQGELAARLNVTHQAVSKWENAAALPDIATLLALSRLFGVSMEEMLTGEAPASAPAQKADTAASPSEDISRPANCAPPSGSAEQPSIAEAAPVPAQPESNPEEKSTGNTCDWNQIIALAPFTSRETLSRLVFSCVDRCDYDHVIALAPFLPGDTLSRLVLSCADRCDFDRVIALSPFLPRETVGQLAQSCLDRCDFDRVIALAPFLPCEMVGQLAQSCLDRCDYNHLIALAPFLPGDTLSRLVLSCADRCDYDHLVALAPFLPRETVDQLLLGGSVPAPSSGFSEREAERQFDEAFRAEHSRSFEDQFMHEHQEEIDRQAAEAEAEARYIEQQIEKDVEQMTHEIERQIEEEVLQIEASEERLEEMARQAERHAKRWAERAERRAERREKHAEHQDEPAQDAASPFNDAASFLKQHMGKEAFQQMTEGLKSAAAGMKALDAFAPFLKAHMSPDQFCQIREAADAASRSAESQLRTPTPSDRRTEICACRTLAELADRIAAQLYAACDATDPALGRVPEIQSAIVSQDYRALNEFAAFLDRHVGPEWLEEMAELIEKQPLPDDLAAQIDRAIAQRNWDWIEHHAHEITDKELIRRIALISSAEGYFDLIPLFIDELDQASFDHAARQAVRLNRPDDALPFAHRVSPGILK